MQSHFPSLVCPQNTTTLPEYTGKKVKDDKPEEIELPYERLVQLLGSGKPHKALVKICEKFKISTRGGSSHMLARILQADNKSEFYSTARKKFFSITGKTGGLLRGICPHGANYGLKHLTLPESVADYTSMLLSFKIPPNVAFSDIASLVANHTNNHFPNFFRPYQGRIDDFEDARSDLYKTGQKKAVLDFKCHTSHKINISNFSADTEHPVSKSNKRLSLYDRFHYGNHNEIDAHLRNVDNTTMEGKGNTSCAEQQNHKVSLTKLYTNKMGINQYIKLTTYVNCLYNSKLNKKWQNDMETQYKCKWVLDENGLLVKVGTNKDNLLNDPDSIPLPFNKIGSPTPVPNLLNPRSDSDVTSINSLIYLLSFSPLSTDIVGSDIIIDPIKLLVKYVSGCEIYDVLCHQRTTREIITNLNVINSTGIIPSTVFML